VLGAGFLLQITVAVAKSVASVDRAAGPVGAAPVGEASAKAPVVAAPAASSKPAAADSPAPRADETAAVPMRQGVLLVSLRSDSDDESGVLAMLEEQQATIELVLSAHFGSEDVRIVDITPAAPEDVGKAAEEPELQLCRLAFEMAAPAAQATEATAEDGAVLQFSLQQSLDELDARLAIEDLAVTWDDRHAAAGEEMPMEMPSTTLYV